MFRPSNKYISRMSVHLHINIQSSRSTNVPVMNTQMSLARTIQYSSIDSILREIFEYQRNNETTQGIVQLPRKEETSPQAEHPCHQAGTQAATMIQTFGFAAPTPVLPKIRVELLFLVVQLCLRCLTRIESPKNMVLLSKVEYFKLFCHRILYWSQTPSKKAVLWLQWHMWFHDRNKYPT